jgi:hypothetical protein
MRGVFWGRKRRRTFLFWVSTRTSADVSVPRFAGFSLIT